MKKMLSILLAGLMVVSLAACGGEQAPAQDNGETTDNQSSQSESGEPSSGSDEELTFYFISKTLGSQYFSVVEDGIRTAAEELGVNIVATGLQSESDVEKQVQLLQDAVTAQADAIIIAPCDSNAMVDSITEAYESGIPIILVDTIVNCDAFDICIKTDNYNAGAVCAQKLIEELEGEEEVTVGLQVASVGSQTVNERLDGFREYWDANAPEGWTVLWDEMKVNDADITKAVANGQDLITAHPELNAFWGVNNSGTVGFGTALKELDRKDIALVGLDFSTDTDTLIHEGYTRAAVVQQQYDMGYQGVYAAMDIINGKTPEEKVVDTGVYVVDIDNIDTEEAQAIMYPGGK